ncbi:DUF2577 domain-containing protein [Anaerotignum sp.]|uniref:DUF2577 domain-containing protein n=1 Tax=Anaerotignum sp. TaxID=2039241 RepID=UPI002896A4EE|nr:DUF2577 domain-containing protein [Anaerotignum sp.]
MSELLQLIKQAAKEQVESSKPVAVMIGKVVSAAPLEIQLDQKLRLTQEFLVLTKAVVDYSVNMTVNHTTETHTHSHSYQDDSTSRTTQLHTHNHAYVGTKSFTIHNKLKVDDHVMLLRVQGGQQYVVLDVVGGGIL